MAAFNMFLRNFADKSKKYIIFLVIFLFFSNLLNAQSLNDVDEAVRRLDAALSGNASAVPGLNIQQPPIASVTTGGVQPRWVNDPYIAYNRNHFIAAIGSAQNRNQAEARAFAALAAIFGQSIKSEFTVTENYSEAVNKGVVSISQNTRIRDEITTAASMDKLVGAEIGNVWDSGRGTVYVTAYMNKLKTISIYTDMIIINNRNIELLTSMEDARKNTFDGYARFRLAALIAGINSNYAAVISHAGGSVLSLNLRNADSLNIEAVNILRNITITVNVTNDRANRVQDAFAGVLSSEGLRTRGNNPVYSLEVRLNASEATYPGNNFIFCRIEGSANLIENSTGASLFPFSFNFREGHTSYANAEAMAFSRAEREIKQNYPSALREYLASLAP